MTLPLGVLDQSPILSGHAPRDAVAETVRLAEAADRLGYARYWLAEHHGIEALGDPCPEILTARVAAATSRIRVGTGGVMRCSRDESISASGARRAATASPRRRSRAARTRSPTISPSRHAIWSASWTGAYPTGIHSRA
jgi:hypothetical protein